MMDNFAVFILSHGRANNVITYRALRNQSYTGDIFIIVDDHDLSMNEYKKIYGNNVIVFDKNKYISETDRIDNFDNYSSVVYARNAVWDIAKNMGLEYFLVLDDDYSVFYFTTNNDGEYISTHKKIKNLDRAFSNTLKFLESTQTDCIAWSQGGDFIGGEGSGVFSDFKKNKMRRKIMNSFFCKTSRRFKFLGTCNDDVNTYIHHGNRGKLMFTYAPYRIKQERTQQQSGGLTELYENTGTYVKSFYTAIIAPSCTKINKMGVSDMRFHHKILWKYAMPCILSEDIKK